MVDLRAGGRLSGEGKREIKSCDWEFERKRMRKKENERVLFLITLPSSVLFQLKQKI
jgi:hypothetical protein